MLGWVMMCRLGGRVHALTWAFTILVRFFPLNSALGHPLGKHDNPSTPALYPKPNLPRNRANLTTSRVHGNRLHRCPTSRDRSCGTQATRRGGTGLDDVDVCWCWVSYTRCLRWRFQISAKRTDKLIWIASSCGIGWVLLVFSLRNIGSYGFLCTLS